MASRVKPPTPGGLARRLRRRTANLSAAVAILKDAVPRTRRDDTYHNAVAAVEYALADLESLGLELPGLVSSMLQAARSGQPLGDESEDSEPEAERPAPEADAIAAETEPAES